ncbi:MAG: Jag N-terminal domain-containing protein [Blautia sp.]|nr:Jag N-terminal domain-containing protein [Blautia sp.]
MGEYTEYSAKTKSEAITKACIELGVSSDELDIQVVSEGSSGFFGIGSRPAVIRVRRIQEDSTDNDIREIIETVSTEKIKEDEKKNASRQKSPSRRKENSEKKEQPEKKESAGKKDVTPAKPETPAKKDVQPSVDRTVEQTDDLTVSAGSAENEEEQEQPKERTSRNRHRDRRRKDKERPSRSARTAEESVQTAVPAKDEEEEKPVHTSKPIKILTDEEEIADVENRARVFLNDIFGAMDLGEVEITSVYNREEGSLDVVFEGEDMGVLIGKRGQTLDSLQYLTSLVVNKGKDDYIRVKLDTEDYRRRRQETLENLARGIAYKVKKTRRPVVLEPMNPYERRIIHSSLQSNKYVETISEGEEPYRHVVVKLKKNI